MKKMIILIILILVSVNSYAQSLESNIKECNFPDCFKYDKSKVSKAETIKWILDKINSYHPQAMKYHYVYQNGFEYKMSNDGYEKMPKLIHDKLNYSIVYFKASFLNDNLIIDINTVYSNDNIETLGDYNSLGEEDDDTDFFLKDKKKKHNAPAKVDYHYEIPIKELQFFGGMQNGGSLVFSTLDNNILENENDKSNYTNWCSIPFDERRETNINIRLKKAFIHLVHSLWKPVKGEPY